MIATLARWIARHLDQGLGWLAGLFPFLKGVLSEPNGNPSSSRLLMYIHAAPACFFIVVMTRHLTELKDTAQITTFLANIPLIVASLTAFVTAPYAVNRVSGAFAHPGDASPAQAGSAPGQNSAA